MSASAGSRSRNTLPLGSVVLLASTTFLLLAFSADEASASGQAAARSDQLPDQAESRLDLVVRTGWSKDDGTTGSPVKANLWCQKVPCGQIALDHNPHDDLEEGQLDHYTGEIGLLERQGTTGSLTDLEFLIEPNEETGNINDWVPSCVALYLDGKRIYCAAPPEFQLGDRAVSREGREVAERKRILLQDSSPSCGCGHFGTALTHGPVLGAVKPTVVEVWLRTYVTQTVEVLAFDSRDGTQPVRATSVVEPDGGGIVRLEGLTPDTGYRYVVRVDGQQLGSTGSPLGTFRTPPLGRCGLEAELLFGFGSCANQNDPHTIFRELQLLNLDLFLFLGDNHYGPGDYTAIDARRELYLASRKQRALERFLRTTPALAVWDDHDYGANNAAGNDLSRCSSLRAFKEAWPTVAEWPPKGGVYQRYDWCDLATFVLLDTRFFRGLESGTALTEMLGSTQVEWLAAQNLPESSAAFTFLVSSVPWSGGGDGWSDDARAEVLGALRGVTGLVLLSGDVHRSEFRCHRWREASCALPELVSSGLTIQTAAGGTKCGDIESDTALRNCVERRRTAVVLKVKRSESQEPVLEAGIHVLTNQGRLSAGPQWRFASGDLDLGSSEDEEQGLQQQ